MPTATLRTDASFGASSDSFPTSLYRVVMLTPGGLPETVELRATTEALALERAAYYKPFHRIACDRAGNPLVSRRPTP